MQIMIGHRGVRSSEKIDGAIEQRLFEAAQRLPIEIAHVQVERRWTGGAAYRVVAHLETPGVDVKAEAADQTLGAAVHKFARALDRAVDRRLARRQRRPARPRYGPGRAKS